MVDCDKTGIGAALMGDRLEIDGPQAIEPALAIDEVQQAAADAADGRDLELARTNALAERLLEKVRRAADRRLRVLDPQRDRADRGAVRDVEGVGEALLLAVDDDVDVALLPARDVLGFVDRLPG